MEPVQCGDGRLHGDGRKADPAGDFSVNVNEVVSVRVEISTDRCDCKSVRAPLAGVIREVAPLEAVPPHRLERVNVCLASTTRVGQHMEYGAQWFRTA